MKKILIAGDSWGCGEWDFLEPPNKKYGISHKGLEQFFLDFGCGVDNVSVPGASNLQSIDRLKDALILESYDYVFWFQTDPLRECVRGPIRYHMINQWYVVDDLLNHQDILLDEAYLSLSEVSTVVYCIGGCSKIDVSKLSKYDNLVCLIPSVIEFCVPDRKHHIIHFSDWLDYIPKHFEDFERLTEIKYQADEMHTLEDLVVYFYPDGRHANRLGHKKIFDYIIDYFKLDKNFS